MEPRARAGKNVGKMNFGHNERTPSPLHHSLFLPRLSLTLPSTVAQLLYGHGDVRAPLNETVRVLDEILTEFIQGVSFEATRAAQHAGRQKVKFEDFEFAMRRNPTYMGKIQEVFEKKKEIEAARKNFSIEDQLMKDADKEEKAAEKDKEKGVGGGGKRGRKSASASQLLVGEEDLEDGDDDLEEVGSAGK
jgi:transcription initiation factor TFIID subunit 13